MIAQSASTSAVSAPTAPPPRSLCAACTRPPSPLRRPLPCYARSSGVLWGVEGMTEHQPVLGLHVGHGRQHPLRPRRGGTSIKGSWPGGPGGGAPQGKSSGLFHFYAHFSRAAASRHAPRKRALHVSALWSVLGSVFHVGCRAACALVLHCSQPLGHTACQAC